MKTTVPSASSCVIDERSEVHLLRNSCSLYTVGMKCILQALQSKRSFFESTKWDDCAIEMFKNLNLVIKSFLKY